MKQEMCATSILYILDLHELYTRITHNYAAGRRIGRGVPSFQDLKAGE